MNNEIKDWRGNVLGYKCFECGKVFGSMWGVTCNGCREKERRHNEMIEAISQSNRSG